MVPLRLWEVLGGIRGDLAGVGSMRQPHKSEHRWGAAFLVFHLKKKLRALRTKVNVDKREKHRPDPAPSVPLRSAALSAHHSQRHDHGCPLLFHFVMFH